MKNRFSIVILALTVLFAIVLGISPHVQANVIYSSFGSAPGYSNSGYTAGWGPCGFTGAYCQTDLAAGFTSTLNYTLDSISFAASYVSGATNSLSIYLASGATEPDMILESFSFTNLSSEPSIYSAGSSTHSILSAGTQYWFVFSPYDETAITWWTGSQYIPPTLLTGYGSGIWVPGTPLAGQTAFSVEGTPVSATVPEPATMLLLGSGLGGLALLKRKARMQLSKAGIYYGGIVMRRILIGILLTGIIFVVAPVKADNIAPLPPSLSGLYPTTNTANANIVQSSIGGVGWSDSSTSATLQWFGGIGSAQASVITLGGALPSVKVSVSAAASASWDSGGDGSYAYATNEYMYYFRVYDPSPVRVYVPVTIDYSIGATKSSSSSDDELTSIYWSVVAQFSPYGYFERPFFRGASWPGDISGNVPEGLNTLNLDYWFLTNTVYPMKLNAYATVKCTASADYETGSDCSVAASAYVDPSIKIAADWLRDNPGAQLQIGMYAADIPGPSPVPEPSTMLLFGSGLIGLAGYGRKKLFKK